MTFTRANPGGWAVGDELTSAQQNKIDIDHANALDKSVAGDTLAGVVVISGAGQLLINRALGIQANIATSINASISSGISTSVPGGITLNGGATDNITFFPTRTRAYDLFSAPFVLQSGWTINTSTYDIVGQATTTGMIIPLAVHHGAVLSTVAVFVQVLGPHTSLPANLPVIAVRRVALASGSPLAFQDLSTNTLQSPGPATAAAWDNSGNLQSWVYLCNQNNAIDTTQYKYFVAITDENGANSVAGNRYAGIQPSFTNIADMRFW